MKKIFFITLLILFVEAGIAFTTWAGKHEIFPVHKAMDSNRQEVQAAVDVKTNDVPAKLSIPKLGVVASVESVGMDKKGRMDVPKDADNVAWYNLGYKPGDEGNAVMAGHFDKVTGEPAVFYNIEDLQVGDRIITTDVKGKENIFSVISKKKYPYDNFPLQKVFGATSKRMLNLVTCEGQWNSKTKNYSHRTVVYAQITE